MPPGLFSPSGGPQGRRGLPGALHWPSALGGRHRVMGQGRAIASGWCPQAGLLLTEHPARLATWQTRDPQWGRLSLPVAALWWSSVESGLPGLELGLCPEPPQIWGHVFCLGRPHVKSKA